MNKLSLAILVGCALVGSHGFAQEYVPPPPSRSFGGTTGTTISPPKPSQPVPGTRVYAPPAPEVKFGNGARVVIYNDKFVFMAPDGSRFTKKRPLPDLARNPYGCKWLRHYLDTTSPYSHNWIDNCYVYLERCMNLR